MQTMHLFAGGGGGLLADLILGHKPIIAVERDKSACQILRERAAEGWFPDLQVWEGDVRMFDPSEYAGKVDCINAGFPCQPYSVDGSRKGAQDSRDLFTEVYRCIQVVRPEYVFLENVPGLLTSKTGTCVCGWPYRRGGLHSHTQAAEKDCSNIYSCCANGDDKQGESNTGYDAGNLWRAFLRDGLQQEAQEMGEPMAMAYQWGRSMSVFGKDSAIHNAEKESSGTCIESGRYEKDTTFEQKWNKEMEPEAQSQSSRYERENAPTECDRPRCPECGSRLVSSESESVWYMGAIQQALSSLGYMSQWTTLSAAEVGAKHKRNRWWLLAYTTGERVQGGGSDWKQKSQAQAGQVLSGCNSAGGERYDGPTEPGLGGMVDDVADRIYPNAWNEVEAEVGRVTDEKRNRAARLKALGNGQVPLQAAAAFRYLWEVMEAATSRSLEPCSFCGYKFDHELLGRYGCPNCEGEGLQKEAI